MKNSKRIGFLTSALVIVMVAPFNSSQADVATDCVSGQYLDNSTCRACPNEYPFSAAASESINDCYRECTTDDVQQSTAVSGKYFYGDNNQCGAVTCAAGYTAKSGIDFSNLDYANMNRTTSVAIYGEGASSFNEATYGVSAKGQSYYGITTKGEWAADFSDFGTVRGTGICSTTPGDNNNWKWTNPTILSSLTDETGAQYCWCNLTGYRATGESSWTSLSSSWVFHNDLSSASYCASDCASYCAGSVGYTAGFRSALFGSVGTLPASCELEQSTLQDEVDVNNNSYIAGGHTNSNGNYNDIKNNRGQYYFGLSGKNLFAVELDNFGILYGKASCNSTAGENNGYNWTDPSIVQDSAFNTNSNGSHCWCQINGYKANNNAGLQNLNSSWVYNFNNGSDCNNDCSYNCAGVFESGSGLRSAMLSVTSAINQDCPDGFSIAKLSDVFNASNTSYTAGGRLNTNGSYNDIKSNRGQSYYGLYENNSFAVELSNFGILYGKAACSYSEGENNGYSWTNPSVVSNADFEVAPYGTHCWCQLNGYRANSSANLQYLNTSWVYNFNNGSDCNNDCSYNCAGVFESGSGLRSAMMNVTTAPNSTCSANNISINWYNLGDLLQSNTCTYGQSNVVIPEVPERTGYDFGGWKVVE